MYIIRDIFHLHFGKYKEARALLDEAYSRGLLPDAKQARILTDFTGRSYRLVFEEGHTTLSDYERSLQVSMKKAAWKKWYEKFKPFISYSEREIMQQIL